MLDVPPEPRLRAQRRSEVREPAVGVAACDDEAEEEVFLAPRSPGARDEGCVRADGLVGAEVVDDHVYDLLREGFPP